MTVDGSSAAFKMTAREIQKVTDLSNSYVYKKFNLFFLEKMYNFEDYPVIFDAYIQMFFFPQIVYKVTNFCFSCGSIISYYVFQFGLLLISIIFDYLRDIGRIVVKTNPGVLHTHTHYF